MSSGYGNANQGCSDPGTSYIGWDNKPFTYRNSGYNSQGDHYCSRDYGPGAPNRNSYHYSNRDGSYYYSNPDNSTYYNNGRGYARYTPPQSPAAKNPQPTYYQSDSGNSGYKATQSSSGSSATKNTPTAPKVIRVVENCVPPVQFDPATGITTDDLNHTSR